MHSRSLILPLIFYCASCALGQETADAIFQRGAKVYADKCANCHGDKGQGVADAYEKPLVGDSSLGELTSYITSSMPEGEEDQCVGEDASAVARFVHYSFYSEAARVRNRPPRIGLARLTGSQLRQSLADLFGSQEGPAWTVNERGLEARYYNKSNKNRKYKKIERTDPVIDFDFGNKDPAEGVNARDYLIEWKGSLLVENTGRHEIIVRSTCAFEMTLGKWDRQFIDNRVQSGDKTEFRKSIVLTGGRAYPMILEFIQRKRKTKQPPAKVSLSWVTPNGTEQIIPQRNLMPSMVPAAFSLQSKLPPDDRSYGYDRGIAVDAQWDQSTTSAAVEFAEIAAAELWPDYQQRHRKDSNENRARLRGFLKETVETAFRGPLSDELKKLYIDQQLDATEDDLEAIKRVMLATLKSPRFLYPLLDADRTKSQRAANRLALTLFDGLPFFDNGLQKLIEKDKLQTEDQIREACWGIVGDFRVRGKMRQMVHEWLNLGRFEELSKDQELFPGFDDEVVADLRLSLNTFIDDVIWSENGKYKQLFQSDWTMTSDKLAEFYGETWKPAEEDGARLRRSVADADRRFGIITHPYLMSGLAYHDTTSPIHRGVFLIRYMLGRALRPPNEAFTPFSADLHPNLTTRERVELQTKPENCQGCHVKINGLGFTLENFDAVGRYREKEREKLINPTGQYTSRSDQKVDFENARQLAEYLANSEDAHRAFVSRMFQHFVKQPPAAYGVDTLDSLVEKFQQSDGNIKQLLIEIAVIAAKQP